MIVADTNLIVHMNLPGPHTTEAERVFEQDSEWAAPVLWRSEFRNVLALYLRKKLLTREACLTAFRYAEASVLGREFTVETERVLDLVESSTCSAYDCEFVSLAKELGVPLITSDAKILREFSAVAVAPATFLR